MANRYWVGGAGTWDDTTTTHWSASSGGAGGASVPTASDNVFIDSNSGTPGIILLAGSGSTTESAPSNIYCLDFTVSASGWTFNAQVTSTITYYWVYFNIYGSISITSGISWYTQYLVWVLRATDARTITISSSITASFPGATGQTGLAFGSFSPQSSNNSNTWGPGITFTGTGSWTLNNDITTVYSYIRFESGTLKLNNFKFYCNVWDSSAITTRIIDFGTSGVLIVSGLSSNSTGIKRQITFDMTNTTNYSQLGTSNVNIYIDNIPGTLSGGVYTISPEQPNVSVGGYGTLAVANTLNFLWTANTQRAAITSVTANFLLCSNGTANNVTIDPSLSINFATSSFNNQFYVQGNFNGHANTNFVNAYGYARFFSGTPGTKNLTFNSYGSTTIYTNGDYTLTTNITSTAGYWSHFGGTLNLNGKTLTTAQFYLSVTGLPKTLIFNGGSILGYGSNWFSDADTGFTTVLPGTGLGKIRCLSTYNPNNFIGSNTVYAANLEFCTGATTNLSGNSTFNNISANGTSIAPTIAFAPGTTTTVNNFTFSGSSATYKGTLKTSAVGTFTLTSPNSITANVSYLNIANSVATGAATWYALTKYGNVNNGLNTGWIFSTYNVASMMPFFY